jgi:F-type H+-transporting ATPase subunit beta
VVGEPVDEGGPIEADEPAPIHQPAPEFRNSRPNPKSW